MIVLSRKTRLAVIVTTCIVAAGLNLFLFMAHNKHQAEIRDTRAATSFVESTLPQLMSYRPDNIDSYRETSLGLTAGPFRAKLSGVLDDAFVKNAKAREVAIRTTVQSVGVTRSRSGRVTFVVYVNQWRTSSASKAPTLENSRLNVAVERNDGHWRVVDLNAV